MSLINKEISDFSAQAYQNGEFRTVTKQDVLGKWSLFFFYPADFTFVCPTELEDLQNKYAQFKAPAARFIPYPPTHISCIRRGTTTLSASARSLIPCWPTPHMR